MESFILEQCINKRIFIYWMILCLPSTHVLVDVYLKNVLKVIQITMFLKFVQTYYFYVIGFLKEKTCILITHQVQYLTDVDQIVLMENVTFDVFCMDNRI